jgi:Rv2525c-like, glycoside hydrolase-like domain
VWATTSAYQFVGFYFDAPCHTTKTFKSWSGKSAFIRASGLGLAIVYVGFQQDGCGKNKLSRAAGTSHGEDTIAKVKAEGFAAGTIVFLDVENYSGALSATMADYIRGWIGALLDEGTVRPGIYCPARKANAIRSAAKKEYADHGRTGEALAFWIVKVTDRTFNTAKSVPADCGVAFANVWQGVIDTQEEHGDVRMKIDQNVADSTNPSMA